MLIYKEEASIAGLADKILANTSLAYNVHVNPRSKEDLADSIGRKESLISIGKSNASISDTDLYPTKSILVSTNWNKNDDVFDNAESWMARNTASHKPTNLEHDEKRLVGHITDTWAVDGSGDIIPDNTYIDDLPELYHIANGAVIYTAWEDDKLIERTQALIEDIEKGEMFVSMECLFRNFAYAVITPEKEFYVIDRNKETAFLTKALRIYGGSGEYDGCTIGRLLRNITFSGKGYVKNPANTDSIIFDDLKPFSSAKASTENIFKTHKGVFISKSNSNLQVENKVMPETVEFLSQERDEMKKTISSLNDKVQELTKANSEAGVKALEAKVVELEESVAKMDKESKEKDEKYAKSEETVADLNKKLEEATASNKELAEKIEAAEAAKVKADRISVLVDGGVEKEVAEKKVELYQSLNDEQFQSIASDIVAAVTKAEMDGEDNKKDKEEKAKKDKASADDLESDETADSADASVLDNVDTEEETNLSTDASADDDTKEDISKSLASFLGFTKETK